MRIDIMVDDGFMQEAMRHANTTPKHDVIEIALKEHVRNHSRKDFRDLRGKIQFWPGYDYKTLRAR